MIDTINNAGTLAHLFLDAPFAPFTLANSISRLSSSLRTVTITGQEYPINWSPFGSLEHVNVFATSSQAFLSSTASLKSLTLTSSDVSSEFSSLSQFTALEELTLTVNDPVPSSGLPLPSSLTSLTLRSYHMDSPLTIIAPKLKYLRFSESRFSYVGAWPPTVETLVFDASTWFDQTPSAESVLPPSLVSLEIYEAGTWSGLLLNSLKDCHNLTNAYFDYNMEDVLVGLPRLADTNLRNLTIRTFLLPDSRWTTLICENILNASTTFTPVTTKFDYLYLANEAAGVGVPPCLRFTNATTLILASKSLNLSFVTPDEGYGRPERLYSCIPSSIKHLELIVYEPLGAVDWASFLSRFYSPLQDSYGLKSLRIVDAGITGQFPTEPLTRFAPTINEIDFTRNNMNGTLPADLFASLLSLQNLNISCNSFSGAVPHLSWFNLERLVADGNLFTTWPSMSLSSSNVKVVNLANNNLTDIPHDSTFGNMTGLTDLNLNGNRYLAGALPNVFGGNSRVERFDASDCAFDGPFPLEEISNPVMTSLSFSNNRVCGPAFKLPALGGTMISTLTFANNRINGSYPYSWGTLQAGRIDVSSNLLIGALPAAPAFAYGYASVGSYYNFSNNGFAGDMFDASTVRGAQYLGLQNTNVEFCVREINGMSVTTCDLPHSICSCTGYGYDDSGAGCANIEDICGLQAPPPNADLPLGRRAAPPTAAWSFWRYLKRQNVPPPPVLSADFPEEQPCAASVVRQPARAETPPPSAPIPSPPAALTPVGCSSPAPSGNNWICSNGTWTSTGTVTTPVFTVPSTTIIVTGDLNVTDSIIVSAGSTVIVQGCIYLGNGSTPHVTLELTKEDLDRILKQGGHRTFTLLQTTGNNSCPGSTDLSTVQVDTKSPKSSCRKSKIENTSTKSSLSLLMSVDRGNCDLAIIIPSVIGGVLVLTAAAVVTWVVIKKHNEAKGKRALTTGITG